MCLILFAYKTHPRYRLVLGANRDEFYTRATAPLDHWQDHPGVLAGRDLEQNGTWMGVTRDGRLAAVTNYRDPRSVKMGAPSRGRLVADYLLGQLPAQDYLQSVAASAGRYNGFNLIVGDAAHLLYFSNQEKRIRPLAPGYYGLSNHLLDTSWPKVESGKEKLRRCLDGFSPVSAEALMALLADQTPAPDERLPSTGVDLAWEKLLSPIFITSPHYGTRSSSVLMIDAEGHTRFSERTWVPAQAIPQEQFTRDFELAGPNAEWVRRNAE